MAEVEQSDRAGLYVRRPTGYDRPPVSVADVRKRIGTTYPTADSLVARMTDLGILREVTGYARNRRFLHEPYVRLFTEEPSGGSA